MTEEKPAYPEGRAQFGLLGWGGAIVDICRDNGIVGGILLILLAPTLIASVIVGIFLMTISNAIFGRPNETGESRTSDHVFAKIHLGCIVIAILFNIYFWFRLLEIILS